MTLRLKLKMTLIRSSKSMIRFTLAKLVSLKTLKLVSLKTMFSNATSIKMSKMPSKNYTKLRIIISIDINDFFIL